MNSTQRQPGPLGEQPAEEHAGGAAEPRHGGPDAERLVARSRRPRKVVVSVESAAGESIAAPMPCANRAPTSSSRALRQPAEQRGAGEHDQAGDEHAAAPEQVGGAPAEQQEAAVGEDVAVDDPLQALLAEAEVAP